MAQKATVTLTKNEIETLLGLVYKAKGYPQIL